MGDRKVVVVTGVISYSDEDGKKQRYKYTADENGFRIKPYEIIRTRIGGNVIASLAGGGLGWNNFFVMYLINKLFPIIYNK